jgi:hypothetical protein
VQILGWFLMLFCGYGLVLGLLHKDELKAGRFPVAPQHYWLVWATGALLGLWLVIV